MAKMILFTHLIWFETMNVLTHAQGDFFQTDLYIKMEQAWSGMCPGVDICVRNAKEPTALPNGSISNNQISCCHGCSCHERCHENANCCFSDFKNEGADHTHTTTLECLHLQTGESSIVSPAYRIVTTAPSDGCKPNVICSGSNYTGLDASCGQEPVAPWGNLFPVYSVQHKEIYKNELCACCHGVVGVVPWQAFLVCDSQSSWSDNTQFLEDGELDSYSNCFVTFRYADVAAINDKRCYFDTISTCDLNEVRIDSYHTGTFSNLTAAQIIEACDSGLNSPVEISKPRYSVYKNVFCSICNGVLESYYLQDCSPSNQLERFDVSNRLFTILSLDIKFFQKINRRKQIQNRAKIQQVCVRESSKQEAMSCRQVLCPSGQIRDEEGDCIFPTQKWYVDGVVLFLKLRYTGINVLSLISKRYIDVSELKATLQETSPWPFNWKLQIFYHSISNTQSEQLMVLKIWNDKTNLGILYTDILRSIGKTWHFALNGSSYAFKQSILENHLQMLVNRSLCKPTWMFDANNTLLLAESTRQAAHTWIVISAIRKMARLKTLTKLFTCKQVGLNNEEYSLMANKGILVSNLTKKILFDAEFELVRGSKGTESARVCLSDSVFKTEPKTSDSKELRNNCLFLYVVVTMSITWTIGLL